MSSETKPPADWQGYPITADEPDDTKILVWVIAPGGPGMADEVWERDYHRATELANESLYMRVDDAGQDDLIEHGVAIKMKLRWTTVGEYNALNYNNSTYAFRNYGETKPDVTLTLVEGHVWAGEDGYIARCQDDTEAAKLLTEAGYVQDGDHFLWTGTR